MKIGELSAQTRRSVHTIRWYEAQGLIPGVLRDSGGRRIYQERHVAWLNLIDRLRQTGMSIAQMRDYTALVRQGSQTSREQLQLLAAHRDHVTRTIWEWTAARALIDHKIDFYRERIATGRRPSTEPAQPPHRCTQHGAKRGRRVSPGQRAARCRFK